MCAKLRTAAASNNKDHATQSLFAYASRYVQSFTRSYQQSYHVAISLIIACSLYAYIFLSSRVRGESHNQRNTTEEIATDWNSNPMFYANPLLQKNIQSDMN